MFVESKLNRLGEITVELCKNVTYLEVQVKPSTPPEVLEEITMTVAEVVKKIEEVEALCTKEVNKVSHTWEVLVNDAELEKFIE